MRIKQFQMIMMMKMTQAIAKSRYQFTHFILMNTALLLTIP